VSGMFPVWPRLQDWQNEFYKLLLKEKYGSLITLGKGQFSISKGPGLALVAPQSPGSLENSLLSACES
ncbi:hypothetical protein HGM15179_020335, partial [Zosterops borbonicus]